MRILNADEKSAEGMIDCNRDVLIDNARAICTLYIVAFWHFQEYADNISLNNWFTYNICIGVLGCFFIISGFLNYHPFITKKYIIKKFFRLVPLYLLSVLSLYAVSYYCGCEYFKNTWQFVMTLLLLAPIFNCSPPTIWFVILLVYFIIISELIEKIGLLKQLLLFLILCIFIYVTSYVDYRIVVYYICFLLGNQLNKYKISLDKICSSKFGIINIITYLIILLVNRNIRTDILYLNIMALMGGLSILTLADFGKNIFNNRLFYKVISFICTASYCLYLFHRQILEVLKKIQYNLFGSYVAEYVFLVPLMIVFCYFVQNGYNVICEKLQNKFFYD